MKNLIISFTIISLLPSLCFADCDFTVIKPSADGQSFTYPKALHLCVGQMVEDSATKDQQIADLNKAVQLKDLAITASDQRTQLWSTTSAQLEDRLQKIDSLEKKNDWLYFALGAISIIGAAYVVGQVRR